MAASLSARPHRQLCQILTNRRLPSAFKLVQQYASSIAEPKEQSAPSVERAGEIVIPRKKKRDSLSVLRALASTVTRDPKAPHYKYTDDPFLIPTSNLAKKSYALSKESGRKAARFMLENYAQWFNENPSEPPIEAFMPPEQTYSFTEPSESALLERIEKRRVRDAIEVYKKMKQEQLEVSQDCLHRFLELLCVFNSQDPPAATMPEEFFYRKDLGQDNRRPGKTWRDDDMAERVFDELEEKTSQDRQNLIRGMARHLQTEKAFTMYAEMMDQGIAVHRLTFDLLIRAATFHHDTYESKWKQVESLLQDMQRMGVEPNLSTFNSVLFSLARIPMYRGAPSLALRTLNEMKALGIEPSPASWRHVLIVFYPNENAESDILHKVMDHLEGRELELSDPEDTEFFHTAMRVCCVNLHDPQLAFRIDALLRTAGPHNHLLLADSRLDNNYHSNFLKLVCSFETLDTIMELYQRVTPHLWCPNYAVMEELMKAVELQDGYAYLPLLWTDLQLFQFLNNAELLETLLRLMAKKQQEPELQAQYVSVASQLLQRWTDERQEDRQPTLSTGGMMGHLWRVAVNGGDLPLAWQLFEVYRDNARSFRGTPTSQDFVHLLSGCLESGGEGEGGEKAVGVVRMMQVMEVGGAREAAQSVLDNSSVQLSPAHRDLLASV